jgi:hypothetical protein
MTGNKGTDAPWHHITIVLQPDIYRQAVGKGIDINDACNRALADLTGIDYHRQNPAEVPAPPPVIIARNGSSLPVPAAPEKSAIPKLHPVINADDPAAPANVVLAKVRPVKKSPAEPQAPAPAPVPMPEKTPIVPAAAAARSAGTKNRKTESGKKTPGGALKAFFSSKIARTDETDAGISKDELYELFARFCRDHRITQVPERRTVTIALKNQFALTEKPVNGTACWTGIRLK